MGLKRQKVGVAARRQDDRIAILLNRAQDCLAEGRLGEAQAIYRKVLNKDPDDFETLHLLGVGQHLAGDHEGAARAIKRALEVNPHSAEAHANLGAVLRALGRLENAVASYDRAIALDPDFTNAHYNLGNALLSLERFADAIESYDRAITLKPDHASAFCNRGKARALLRHLDSALADFDSAIALNPSHAAAWTCRGDVMYQKGQLEAALQCFDKALLLDPNLLDPWLGAAQVLITAGRMAEALKVCHRALAVHSQSALALVLLAQCYSSQAQPDAALQHLNRAIQLDPANDFAHSTKIFTLDFASNISAADHYRARRAWWTQAGAKIQRAAPRQDIDRDPDRRLVIGYVSGDFKAISPAYAFRPILQNHDKSRFEIVCYSSLPVEGAVTDSFRAIADRWRDVAQQSDDQAAETILADKVDLLIDLSGHSQGNRLRLFARKLAPVQVTAWGHATGTGVPTIDYLFSDPVTIPVEAREHYAETIWDLPCAIVLEPPPSELRRHEPPMMRNGYLTYGALNRVSKFSDAALAAWAGILQRDSTARLLLKDALLKDESVRAGLLKRFAAHGIVADRIEMIGFTSRDEHLRTYGKVDICLDPFPTNGGVATWEAIYMGVPVVTKLGDTPSSRIGGGIMSAVGLSDFAAETEDDYVRIALGVTAERLQTLRRDLPAMIEATCGPKVYTRAVETAYRSMWQKWCASAES